MSPSPRDVMVRSETRRSGWVTPGTGLDTTLRVQTKTVPVAPTLKPRHTTMVADAKADFRRTRKANRRSDARSLSVRFTQRNLPHRRSTLGFAGPPGPKPKGGIRSRMARGDVLVRPNALAISGGA